MTPAYVTKLGLKTKLTNNGTQKIDGPAQKTYGIISASFLLQDCPEKVRFFEETFLLINTIVGNPFIVTVWI